MHAAGRAFRIQATAVNSAGDPTSNYDGKPEVETLARRIPATCAGCPLGAVTTSGWGKSSTVVGAVRTNNAVYEDVGVVNVQVFDNTFSAVDQVDVDLGLQDPDAGLILSDPLDIGRFVPDNFVVAPSNAASHAGRRLDQRRRHMRPTLVHLRRTAVRLRDRTPGDGLRTLRQRRRHAELSQ